MKKSGGKNKTKKYRYKKKAGDNSLTPGRIPIQMPSYPSNASISQSNKSISRKSLTKTNSIRSANPYSNSSRTMPSKYESIKRRQEFEADREKYNRKFMKNATRKLQSNKEIMSLQKSINKSNIIPPKHLSLMDEDNKKRGDGVKESYFPNVFNRIRKFNPFYKEKKKVNLSTIL